MICLEDIKPGLPLTGLDPAVIGRSFDGRQVMEIKVVSNGMVTAGYGEASLNDGRSFRVMW